MFSGIKIICLLAACCFNDSKVGLAALSFSERYSDSLITSKLSALAFSVITSSEGDSTLLSRAASFSASIKVNFWTADLDLRYSKLGFSIWCCWSFHSVSETIILPFFKTCAAKYSRLGESICSLSLASSVTLTSAKPFPAAHCSNLLSLGSLRSLRSLSNFS